MMDDLINEDAGVVLIRIHDFRGKKRGRRSDMKAEITRLFTDEIGDETRAVNFHWSDQDENGLRLILVAQPHSLVAAVGAAYEKVRARNAEIADADVKLQLTVCVAYDRVRQIRTDKGHLFESAAIDRVMELSRHPWVATPGQLAVDEALHEKIAEYGDDHFAHFDPLTVTPDGLGGVNVWCAPGYGVPTDDLSIPDAPEDLPSLGIALDGPEPEFPARDLARFDIYNGQPAAGEGVVLMFGASIGREERRDLALRRITLRVEGGGHAADVRARVENEALTAEAVSIQFTGDFVAPAWDFIAGEAETLNDKRVSVEAPPLLRLPNAAEGDEITATMTVFALDAYRPSVSEEEVQDRDETRAKIMAHLDIQEIGPPNRDGEITLGAVRAVVERKDKGAAR